MAILNNRKKIIKPKTTPANSARLRTALRQGKILTATKKTSAKDRKLSWKKGSELKKRLAERAQLFRNAKEQKQYSMSAPSLKRLVDLRKRISKLNLKGFTNETLEKRNRTLITNLTREIRLGKGIPTYFGTEETLKHAEKLLSEIRQNNDLEIVSTKIKIDEIIEYGKLEFSNALSLALKNLYRRQ